MPSQFYRSKARAYKYYAARSVGVDIDGADTARVCPGFFAIFEGGELGVDEVCTETSRGAVSRRGGPVRRTADCALGTLDVACA
jgi:hypothetical protein